MKKLLPMLAVLAAGLLLLLRPEDAAQAVRAGLGLCAGTVIPSLFPFFVVISLLLQVGLTDSLQGVCGRIMGPLFGMRGTCALPLLAGAVGGYPAGVRTAAELYASGRLTRQEAELLLGFCDNCGPAFLLGYVGTAVLGDGGLGLRLWGIHLLSALLTGALLCRLSRDRGRALPAHAALAERPSFPLALTSSVERAVGSTVNVCAFVVLFQTLAAVLPGSLPWPVLGFLELVNGTSALPGGRAGFAGAAALVGWGGLSVHCQGMSLGLPEGLSFRWHWVGKAMQALFSALLALALY